MYPFRSRLRWIVASRYRHMLRGFDRRPPSDTLVQERLEALKRWNRVRDVVIVLLYVGIAASVATYVVTLFPELGAAADALGAAAGITGTLAGITTLAYLFLTRLLGQIETDIWTLLSTK